LQDTLLSNKYDNEYMTQKGTASYRVGDKNLTSWLLSAGKYALLTGSNIFPMAYNTKPLIF